MKKILSILMVALFSMQAFAFQVTDKTRNDGSVLAPADKKIEVYYFHNERRCATCEAVESETKKALEEYYSDKMKAGTITFLSVNIEEKTNEALAEKLGISGQTLLFISGEQKADLTNDAFMYARTKPEKLKKEIKKTVDDLLK
jgi:hypothetical protein